ncbi:MAG: DUF2723 domain-containing protein [Rhodothermales bacterium]
MPRVHRSAALLVFAFALGLYGLTVSPSTALWDTGEFIASVDGLQVMHPPGAPVYLLLGRAVTMFVPDAYVALAVNLLSALASALTVLLTYLIVVHLVRRIEKSKTPSVEAILAGAIGSLTFAVSDSFWFSAVEAEVYALSMFLTALIVWLALRWQEQAAHEVHHQGVRFGALSSRSLLLIGYVFGLAVGVHLMALLTFFFLGYLIYFTYFVLPNAPRTTQVIRFSIASIAILGAFGLLYPGVVITLPGLAVASGAPTLFFIAVALLLTVALMVTHQRRMALANTATLFLTAVILGVSTYALIPIRSASNPPIDLNDPETAEALIPYLQRQQYGDTPLVKGRTYDDTTGALSQSDAFFPRRHSFDQGHHALYRNYTSDGDYFMRYQLGHMYVRYLLWNFVGRSSDVQDAPAYSGLANPPTEYVYTTPSEQAGRNAYFGLPLLLGLLGLLYHVRRDPRMAFSVGILFFITGVGLVLYLNEIPRTPRERDYIYVASYFAFALWIGLGALAIIQGAQRWLASLPRRATLAGLTTLLLLVPGWMLVQNYDDHDRTGNELGRDFAYNLLMSVDEDAILFTGGDNDTYPLWYLQNVEGVRRDVTVVCLSILNMPSYVAQLKHNRMLDADPIAFSLSDALIADLQPAAWQPREIAVPVDTGRLVEETEIRVSLEDTIGFDNPMRWTVEGRPFAPDFNILYVVDQAQLDIIITNAERGWERPIYIAATAGFDARIGLDRYLQREGLAYRVVPIPHNEPDGRIVPELMADRLESFRFTNLADSSVYFADDARSMAGSHYRLAFTGLAQALADEGRTIEALDTLDRAMEAVPPATIPINAFNAFPIAGLYEQLGRAAQAVNLMKTIEPQLARNFAYATTDATQAQSFNMIEAALGVYLRAEDFDAAAAFTDQLADVTGNANFRQSSDDLERRYELMVQ